MSNDMVNVLVIGNGFDLALGLPTKYTDFLQFCKIIINDEKDKTIIDEKTLNCISDLMDTIDSNKLSEITGKIKELLNGNIWLNHFLILQQNNLSKSNWIDFESEISLIIQFLDNEENNLDDGAHIFLTNYRDKQQITEQRTVGVTFHKTVNFINVLMENKAANQNFRCIRKRLYDDLQNLAIALDLYLACFVEKMQIKQPSDILKEIQPDVLISFNYTHTYKILYNKLAPKDIYHIHGECKENDGLSNIVIGIDEYWTDARRDSNTNYAIFNKFVQRIQKKTNVFSLGSFTQIDNSGFSLPKILHIFGHSLDITDKDIFKKLFKHNSFSKTVVYCYDKPTEGEYIANIIKIIGQDELIKRVENEKIEFIVLNP